MRAENPDAWAFIIEAAEIRRKNRETVEACMKKANKAKASVRCTIRIGDDKR